MLRAIFAGTSQPGSGPGECNRVQQQAFKHATGIRVAGVIAARVTPISKIPIEGAGPYGYKPEPIEPSAEVMACARLELFAFVKS
jgi:hypothetical protein